MHIDFSLFYSLVSKDFFFTSVYSAKSEIEKEAPFHSSNLPERFQADRRKRRSSKIM